METKPRGPYFYVIIGKNSKVITPMWVREILVQLYRSAIECVLIHACESEASASARGAGLTKKWWVSVGVRILAWQMEL